MLGADKKADTKIVSKIRKSSAIKKKINGEMWKKQCHEQAQAGVESLIELFAEIEELWENSEAIYFENVNVIPIIWEFKRENILLLK